MIARALFCYSVLLAAASCLDGGRETVSHPIGVAFPRAFVLESRVRLLESDTDPIGNVKALVRWGRRLVVVDDTYPNVKVFSADGRLVLTLGQPGDGPGEFRYPIGAAAVGGKLAVFDAALGRASIFDSLGRLDTTWTLPAARAGGFSAMPNGEDLLFAGRLISSTPTTPDSARPPVHILSRDGKVRRTLGRWRAARRMYEPNFNRPLAAVVGPTLVLMWEGAGQIEMYDLQSTRLLHTAVLPAEVYEPPAWPDVEPPGGGMGEMIAWGNRQMWIIGLIPVDSVRFLVRVGVNDEQNRRRASVYLLADTAGATGWWTLPTDVRITAAENCTALGFSKDDDGTVYVETYHMDRPYCLTGADTAE